MSAGCGLRVDPRLSHTPGVLYRSAAGGKHRDVYFLRPNYKSGLRDPYQATKLDSWETATSPKSTWGLCFTHQGWAAAWETWGQIHYAHLDHQGQVTRRYTAPGEGGKRKHPVVLFGGRDLLLAWTEASEGGKGDAVAWQVYSGVSAGKDQPAFAGGVITNTRGRANGAPPGGLISAASNDPFFVIFY